MKPIGLNSLFKEKLFRIPDYQRGYAWQDIQYADFWDDLINLPSNRSHYTGVISLSKVDSDSIKEEDKEYWLVDEEQYYIYNIVDGQQRLTTFIIFIQSLVEVCRKLEDNYGKNDNDILLTKNLTLTSIVEKFLYKKPLGENFRSYKFGYNTDNPSDEYMRYKILLEENPGKIEETFYTLNLKKSKEYFIRKLNELYNEEGINGLQEIYKKITQRFLFNEYIIEDEFDVFVAFETMNNRGKNLSKLELLKNRLIYLTTLFSEDDLNKAGRKNLRDEINGAWKEVYHQLGRNKDKPLSDDDFLKAHWIMSFQYKRQKGDDYINDLLNVHFSPKRFFIKDNKSHLTPKEISKYVNSLKTSAIHWFNLQYPFLATKGELEYEVINYIDKLNRIGIGYFNVLVMSLLKNESSKQNRIIVLKKIERFIFTIIRLKGAISNYGDSEFYAVSRELDKGKISIDEILEKFVERGKFSFNEDGTFKSRFFEDFLYKNFTDGGKGYYNWNGLRYFLYEYELDRMKESGQKKITWEDLFIRNKRDKISIEHIYPQTPTEYWKIAFKNTKEEDLSFYNGSLGNLLLLSSSINSSLQNSSYIDKKQPKQNDKGEFIRMGYSNGSHSEIEVSIKYKNWTPKEIKERGLHLLDFMEKRWNIKLGSYEDKLKLLFLPE